MCLRLKAMINLSCIIFLLTVIAACGTTVKNSEKLGSAKEHDSLINKSSKWIVVLNDSRPERLKGWARSGSYQGSSDYNSLSLDRLAESILSEKPVKLVTQWPIESINVHCLVVTIPKRHQDSVIAELELDKRVKWVQPFNRFSVLAEKLSFYDPRNSSDPYGPLQTSFELLNLSQLDEGISGSGVSIAVVDSGIAQEHPDIHHAITENIDFVDSENQLVRPESHGTGIVGVMSAKRNNGLGIAGIAPKAKIHAYRSCWQNPQGKTQCDSLTLARALDRIAKTTPDIVNLSLSGPKDRLLDSLIAVILSKGSKVFAAYDKKREPDRRFPSPHKGIIFVKPFLGNTKLADNELIAPGTEIITTQPGDTYAFMSGSSMATAHMSSVYALIHQIAPDIEIEDFKRLMQKHSRVQQSRYYTDLCQLMLSIAGTYKCAGTGKKQLSDR